MVSFPLPERIGSQSMMCMLDWPAAAGAVHPVSALGPLLAARLLPHVFAENAEFAITARARERNGRRLYGQPLAASCKSIGKGRVLHI